MVLGPGGRDLMGERPRHHARWDDRGEGFGISVVCVHEEQICLCWCSFLSEYPPLV
jgi:hypothetical protein